MSYIIDQSWARERTRLAALEAALDPGTVYCLSRVGVRAGDDVLEVGAGAGSVAAWLAAAVGPAGSVLATDVDIRFLEGDRPFAVRCHDVVRDELPREAFDLVHARYVLEHVDDRDAALRSMIGALRPGGALVVESSDSVTAWLAPELPASLAALIDAFDRTFDRAGADQDLGRRLPTLLRDAGLVDIAGEARAQVIPGLGSEAGTAYRLSVEQLADRLVADGVMSAVDVEAARAEIACSDVALLSHLTVCTWGRKPG